MACKRSAVRARLAPLVRSEIRTHRTASTAGKYSNGGQLGRRMCVRIGHLARRVLLAGPRIQALNRRWPVCDLDRFLPHRPCDFAAGHHPALPQGHSCPQLLRICKWSSSAGRPAGSDPLPGAPCPLARAAFGDDGLGAGSTRRADDGSAALGPLVRCAAQAQGCAVAQPCARLSACWCAR
jgi:hypothetical protein